MAQSVCRRIIDLAQKGVPRWVFLSAYGVFACLMSVFNLLFRYGFARSAFISSSVNAQGRPIPWFSYPAIEYLDSIDLSECDVFEYGSGNSTLYWSQRARSVVSVEEDENWHRRVVSALNGKNSVILARSESEYVSAVERNGESEFDIVVIDGSYRLQCAETVGARLRKGGMVILDDADDFPDVAALLRSRGLMEIDFAGFNPINAYSKTTSFFLCDGFRPKPLKGTMPPHSISRRAG